ncbi:MAG: HNH endonuclease [Myxococcaceae bacterium]
MVDISCGVLAPKQPESLSEAAAILNCSANCVREIEAAVATDDRWLRIGFAFHADLRDWAWSSLTQWAGFKNGRELRAPRWERFIEAAYVGHFLRLEVAAGPWSYRAVRRKWPRDLWALLHFRVAQHWVPELCVADATLNSRTYGFITDGFRAAKPLLQRRPGRAARTRMKDHCRLCGTTKDLTLHHLLGRAYGGATEPANLVCLCRSCHDKVEEDRDLAARMRSLRPAGPSHRVG